MKKPTPLFILSLSATLLMIGVGMIVALLPQRVHAMTRSLESVGLVASVFAFAYLLAQLPISALSDRLGAKRFLVVGYFLCAVSGVVYVSTETATGLFLGRAIQGLGEAPIWALGPAILSLVYPATKGRVTGIYNAAIHIGLTAGPLLGLLVVPSGQGSLPFLIFAVLCLMAGLCVLVFIKPVSVTVAASRPSYTQFITLLRRKQTSILLLGVLLYGAGYGVFVTVLPVSLALTHGFGTTAISLLFVVFYAAISFSQIVSGTLSDHFGRKVFSIWGMAVAAVGLATFPFFGGLWVYIPLGSASVGLGMFCVASITDLNEKAPDTLKGAISGGYYFFWAAGYVLGPLVIGAIAGNAPLLGFGILATLFGIQALALRRFQG
ncbi:MFS transporter [Roseibium aggregatum]|uniref:MFS transporter n=1 Tax=Roseibium aggregatum TaxID=187304 RepID=A0A939ECP5_9HYPH|nr:MFS transporter [Roseibium aggregatum]MBN9670189.1 MFS transporter [Roseibium aggregatum]